MPRTRRQAPGGFVYHALNRAVARLPLFKKSRDYEAFFRVLDEALARHPIRVLGYCVMPNHWHFVLWPRKDGELTAFLRWLTHTHTMRWHTHFHTAGTGHLYQGRFKSFPVEADDYFYTLMRYVERNALRAGLVRRAEDWPWGSLAFRAKGWEPKARLSRWPVPIPADWVARVNKPQTDAEQEALRRSVNRGTPYGSEVWQRKTAARLGLGHTLRPPGRPKKDAGPQAEQEAP
jgi:putative transposase